MRGEELRQHMLKAAKDVFLAEGFERASMDAVAARAETSKRTLYAHFESKEKLFLAVVNLVRGLFLERVGTPEGDKPVEALVLFCGRFIEALMYEPSVRMARICMAESQRFPQGASSYFDVLFTETHARLVSFTRDAFGMRAAAANEAVNRLLAQILYPRYLRALFGLEPLHERWGEPMDLKPIRAAVAEILGSPAGR